MQRRFDSWWNVRDCRAFCRSLRCCNERLLVADDGLRPIVKVGRNCWRISRADRATVIVDAADYYLCIRSAMTEARRRILIIGWDFDTRIALEPREHEHGRTLGEYFLELAKANPARAIDILAGQPR